MTNALSQTRFGPKNRNTECYFSLILSRRSLVCTTVNAKGTCRERDNDTSLPETEAKQLKETVVWGNIYKTHTSMHQRRQSLVAFWLSTVSASSFFF